MSIELLFLRSYFTNEAYEYGTELANESDLTFSANIMILLVCLVIYLILVCVALYSCFKCNRNHTGWLILNTIVAIFCPTLYLLVHPNLKLAYTGPTNYCNDF